MIGYRRLSTYDAPSCLVVEVLSAVTAAQERNPKRLLYQTPDVQYYLLADPYDHNVQVHELTSDGAAAGNYRPLKQIGNCFLRLLEGCPLKLEPDDSFRSPPAPPPAAKLGAAASSVGRPRQISIGRGGG